MNILDKLEQDSYILKLTLIKGGGGHPDYLNNCYPTMCHECPSEGDCKRMSVLDPCAPNCEGLSAHTGQPILGILCWECDNLGLYFKIRRNLWGHRNYLFYCYPQECCDCEQNGGRCSLDSDMPCSPSCKNIDPDTNEPVLGDHCEGCDFVEEYRETELSLDQRIHI